MKITKKQSITDRFAKALIKGGGKVDFKSLMVEEKQDMNELLEALMQQEKISEEQKEQLKKIIETTKTNRKGLKDLDKLQQEAYFAAREQGKGILKSLGEADKLKEDYEAATTGIRSRFGKIVTAFGGNEELAQVADWVFGKKVGKEEQKALQEKFGISEKRMRSKPIKEKKQKTPEVQSKDSLQQTASKKPRGRIDPATGEFVSTDFGSQILKKETDPFEPVMEAISETPKAVDELVEEEKVQKTVDKILDSVGEKIQPLDVHDKLNLGFIDIKIAIGKSTGVILRAIAASSLGGAATAGSKKRTGRGLRLGGTAAVTGIVGYMAVDAFRDKDLDLEDPEILEAEALAAREAGDAEATAKIQEQITAQMKDVKLRAMRTGAALATAVGGAVVASKIATTRYGRLARAKMYKAKNKVWDLFMRFLEKRAPGIFAKIGVRLAAAGGLALIPIAGWIAAAATVIGSVWLAYDIYKLWREFSALSDAEKALYSEEMEGEEEKTDSQYRSQELESTDTTLPSSLSPPESAPDFDSQSTEVIPPPAPRRDEREARAHRRREAAARRATATSSRQGTNMPGAVAPPVDSGASADELKKYVRLKDNSINLDGLDEQMKERLAGLAKEYFSKTGQKIQINSGYRSLEEQAVLFAKYGAPRAAPPGNSRHESGLAVDINTVDANKATELGLMAKYGFVRPVRGETWHIEPIEVAKSGGIPDNPYNPGKPIIVANDGKEVNPATGTTPVNASASESTLPYVSPEEWNQFELDQQQIAQATPTISAPSIPQAAATPPPAPRATPVATTPISGDMVARQTTEVVAAREQMMTASAAPAIVPVPVGGQSSSMRPMPQNNSQPASTRDSENSFVRALAKDFAHPSAFTTIGTV